MLSVLQRKIPASFFNHPSPTFSPSIPFRFRHCPSQASALPKSAWQSHFSLVLEACLSTPSADAARSLHALAVTTGSLTSIFLGNNLLSLYAAVGEIPSARHLFDEMPKRNAVSYNSMIVAYGRQGNDMEAWKLLSEMMASGLRPTQFTVGSILSSYSSLGVPCVGIQLQTLVLKTGLFCVDAFSGTALLGFFSRHGRLDDALKVFKEMGNKSLVTWNAMITGFAQHGFFEYSTLLFCELLRTDFHLSEFSFLGIISLSQWVVDFEIGEQIHGLVIKNGMCYRVALANAFIDMYARCFDVSAAEKMFNEIPIRDVVSWNTMVRAFAKSEKPEKALEIFLRMLMDGVFPNSTTFATVANSCASSKKLDYGKFIHAKSIKNNLISDVFVGSALVDLYAKFDLGDAFMLFNELPNRNVVSWNALILGCLTEDFCCPVSLLKEMLRLGFRPDGSSFSMLNKSCSLLELQQLHSLIIKMGYAINEYVASSAIVSYADLGLISDALSIVETVLPPTSTILTNVVAGIYNSTGQYLDAKRLIYQLQEPDVISWNTLIEACARNGDYNEAINLFRHMQTTEVDPDKCTYASLLSICSKLCNLALGSALHGLIVKNDSRCCDILICNMLVDMYAKCGNLESSINAFGEITDKNLFSWTTLISGIGLHGQPHEALKRFKEMERQGIKPDKIALIAVLSACRHGGLVEEGIELFEKMKGAYGMEPEMDHYVCMVDLLCRNKCVKEAEQLISSMPFQPNALLWRTFLDGCRRNCLK
ncbi:hypothetical protein ACLOJK_009390 [Asimina triloba]